MQYTRLGKTGLSVSRLCFGTYNFEWYIDQPAEFKLLDEAFEFGINFIDTANSYGVDGKGIGTVEQTLGQWFEERPGNRDQIVLATKVSMKMGEGVNDRGLSAFHIRKACEDSLRRLRTDHIDLYYMHHHDPKTGWDEIWQTFDVLIKQGKILYAGTSNFAAWQVAEGQMAAECRGGLGIIADSSRYNLTARLPEIELLPALRKFGIGFMPWSPIGGGLLGGILQTPTEGRRSRPKKIKEVEANRERIMQYEQLCQSLGLTPAQMALAWLLNNPIVTAPVLGIRTGQQLAESIKALDVKLDQSTIEQLNQIWPGPMGEAPLPYALW